LGVEDVQAYLRGQLAFPHVAEAGAVLVAAAVARVPALLAGAPGEAKTELAHLVGGMFEGARMRTIQLTEETPADALLGPLSLRALDQDRYTRALGEGVFNAHVVVLDEVEKASDHGHHALLSALGEGVVYDEGRAWRHPARLIVGTRNGAVTDPALADRFSACYHLPDEPEGDLLAELARIAPSRGRAPERVIHERTLDLWTTRAEAIYAQFVARGADTHPESPQSFFRDAWAAVEGELGERASTRTKMRSLRLAAAWAAVHSLSAITAPCLWALQFVFQDRDQALAARRALSGRMLAFSGLDARYPYPFAAGAAVDEGLRRALGGRP
jgi:MoxR-like ATPase